MSSELNGHGSDLTSSRKRKHSATDVAVEHNAQCVWAAASAIGPRTTQEDRSVAIPDGWADVEHDVSSWPVCRFFGVFDGHCGEAAAELSSTQLWAELKQRLVALLMADPAGTPPPESLEHAMKDAFAATDATVLARAGSAGSTASVALVLGNALCIANLGDSRTVLCRSERAFWASNDHKPDDPSERARIRHAGGFVATPRSAGQINVPRLNGVLSVSRSFGDAAFKEESTGAGPPLSATPDVTHRTINPRFDEFLLLATDGLFDFYTNAAAVEIARGVLTRASEPPTSLAERLQKASDRLLRAVVHSGHNADNVTAVLAMLGDDPLTPFAT